MIPKAVSSKTTIRWVEVVCILIVFLVLQWRYIFLDLWNDELYTLEYFVFVPKLTTITDYHVPNNHVFANLVFGAWTQAQGIHSVHDIIAMPWNLRLLLLVFAAGKVMLIYFAAERVQRHAGLFAALTLIFTVPFVTYSLQVRGYGLSMFLIATLIWLAVQGNSRWVFIAMVVCAALLAYTIPSNYYVLVSFIGGLVGCFVLDRRRQWLWKAVAAAGGLVLSLALYLPILHEILAHQELSNPSYFKGVALDSLTPVVLASMIGLRAVLAGFILVGLVLLMRQFRVRREVVIPLIIAASTALLPFVLSYIRWNDPPYRVLIVIAPALSVAAGLAAVTFISHKPVLQRFWFIVVILLAAEGAYSVWQTHRYSKADCLRGIQSNYRPQDLVTSYFQHFYEPMRSVTAFAANQEKTLVLIHRCEPHDIRHYLDYHGIPHVNMDQVDSLLETGQSFHAVSSHPWLFMQELSWRQPEAQVKRLSDKISYHNFLRMVPDSIAP